MTVLSNKQLTQFIEEGYCIGRGIFCREQALGIGKFALAQANDRQRSADVGSQPTVMLHGALAEHHESHVVTARFTEALDQLMGNGRWALPQIFGSWPLLFPGFARGAWQPIEMAWHVEGRTYNHYLNSSEIGTTMILLFSDIDNGDGGTAIAVGSHKVVANILHKSTEGLTQLTLTGNYLDVCPKPLAVEACGQAGDVVFLHPFTVHASSLNVGRSVRVACNSRASLRAPMHLNRHSADLSLVERAIVNALTPFGV